MRILLRSLEAYVPSAVVTALFVPALLAVSRWNYLLFHSLIEIVGIVAAFAIFMVGWNARRTLDNGYLLMLGPVFLCAGALDLLHTLAYKGLGVFPEFGANLPTQLWVAARLVEGFGLALAPLFFTRRPRIGATLVAGGALAGGLAAAILSGRWFPDCFVDGAGLTPFKIAAEYVVMFLLAAALALLWRHRSRFESTVFAALVLAIGVKIGAELLFTFYRDVYSLTNLLGHLLKLIAAVLIYLAVVETGISRPFDVLFRSLKRSEEALQAENRDLAAARAALETKNAAYARLIAEKNELLGIAAHDIRSPLAVIEMYSAVLDERFAASGDAKSLKLIGVIRQVTRRALDMVGNLLDFTAIESGRLLLDARPTDLRALVGESLEAHRVLARSKGIEISFEPEEGLPEVPVDPLRFEQVLSNLLSNAVKFSEAGSRITIRLFRRGESVALAVRDEGKGLSPDARKKLFLPFSAGTSGTAGERSTGLGLAIVNKIVASHGGSVEVDSEVGRGATFTALFPVHTPQSSRRRPVEVGPDRVS